jgi:hypothetical protein
MGLLRQGLHPHPPSGYHPTIPTPVVNPEVTYQMGNILPENPPEFDTQTMDIP